MKRMIPPSSIILAAILSFASLVYSEEYAHIYINNNSTAESITAGTWSTVTNFSSGPLSTNWAFNGSTDQLEPTALATGTYFVRYSLSFTGETGTWDAGLSINDADPANLIIERSITSTSDIGNLSASGMITISSTNDKLSLKVRGPGSGSISLTPLQAQLVIAKLEIDNTNNSFAEAFIHSGSSTQSINTSFQTITGYSAGDLQGDAVNGWTFSGNTLTAHGAAAGAYLVTLSMSFEGAAGISYQTGVSVNGANPAQILCERTTSANDLGNVACCGILSISDSDQITVKCNSSSDNKNIQVAYSTLTLVKLTGEVVPPFAEMKILNGSSILGLTQDVWTQVEGLTADQINSGYWQFASNSLQPVNLSAGRYLINYHLSGGQTGSETNMVFEMSTFISGAEENGLTISRKLFKNVGDVGTASGTGIVSIELPTDVLTLSLKNITNSGNIIPEYVNLNLVRIQTLSDGSLPVELKEFYGEVVDDKIELSWTTASEIENLGFILNRLSTNETEYIEIASYKNNDALKGLGNSSAERTYQYIDYTAEPGNVYTYQLIDVDFSGWQTEHNPIEIEFPREQAEDPGHLAVLRSYPNPFNPKTNIIYSLPERGHVEIYVFNVKGQRIFTLVNEIEEKGDHHFIWEPDEIPSGIYYIYLRYSNSQIIVNKTVYVM